MGHRPWLCQGSDSNRRLYAAAFFSSGRGYARDVEGILQKRRDPSAAGQRAVAVLGDVMGEVLGEKVGLALVEKARGMSMWVPTGGMGEEKAVAARALAFSPVVTRVWHCGMRERSAGMSVGVTTSRKASEALSLRRRTSQAVS